MRAADFLCFIGKRYYTRETFSHEAATMGISRRIAHNQIPDDLVCGESKIFVADEGGHDADKPAEVFGYFVPDALEFIGGTEEQKKKHVHIVSKLILRDDTRILGTVHEQEPPRGCGQRKIGGTYIVVDKADSPLHPIDPPATFNGNHFRGLMRLKEDQGQMLIDGGTVNVMRPTQCMLCNRIIDVPPSTLKRAKKARALIEKGETPNWILKCDDCKKLLKAAS
jgi:hypothetical protein